MNWAIKWRIILKKRKGSLGSKSWLSRGGNGGRRSFFVCCCFSASNTCSSSSSSNSILGGGSSSLSWLLLRSGYLSSCSSGCSSISGTSMFFFCFIIWLLVLLVVAGDLFGKESCYTTTQWRWCWMFLGFGISNNGAGCALMSIWFMGLRGNLSCAVIYGLTSELTVTANIQECLPASACSSSFFLPLPPNSLLNKDWRLLVLLWLADADGVSVSCTCASPPSEDEDEEDEDELAVFFSATAAAAAAAASFSSVIGCSDEVAAGGGEVPAASLMLWLLAVCCRSERVSSLAEHLSGLNSAYLDPSIQVA